MSVQTMTEPTSACSDDAWALALARRADWRFLLPQPRLGRVAYLAPHDPALAAALSLVSDVLELAAAPETASRHDVVVLTRGRRRHIPGARALLRQGGWLYAEVPGPVARAWIRALRRSGFEEVSAHWLWPDADTCREIIPLEPDPLLHALSRRDPGARLRLRARMAEVLVASGMLPLVVCRAGVIGRRP
jgi:hypothetical protein